MILNWLQNHLLSCPFKYLTGFDCPGCGFQRAVIALLQGHFNDSLKHYPATIPLILYFAINLFGRDRFFARFPAFKRMAFKAVGAVVICSYILKMALLTFNR